MHSSTNFALLFTLLGCFASAAPVVNKRGLVVVTEWDVVTQTTQIFDTVWVTAGFTPSAPTPNEIATSPSLMSSPVFVASTTSIALTSILGALPTPIPQEPSTPILSTSISTSSLPITTTTPPPPPTAEPAPITSSTALAPSPIVSSSAFAPLTTTTSAAVPIAGLATSGTFYTGDLTFYATGLGSCGLTSGFNDPIVAVSHFIMDVYDPANPNNNPLCGRDVTITFGGKDFQAKVVDTCEGCAEGDLDLSEGFFSEVTGGQMSRGRIGGVQWKWT